MQRFCECDARMEPTEWSWIGGRRARSSVGSARVTENENREQALQA
jgi:hypothetical protein